MEMITAERKHLGGLALKWWFSWPLPTLVPLGCIKLLVVLCITKGKNLNWLLPAMETFFTAMRGTQEVQYIIATFLQCVSLEPIEIDLVRSLQIWIGMRSKVQGHPETYTGNMAMVGYGLWPWWRSEKRLLRQNQKLFWVCGSPSLIKSQSHKQCNECSDSEVCK